MCTGGGDGLVDQGRAVVPFTGDDLLHADNRLQRGTLRCAGAEVECHECQILHDRVERARSEQEAVDDGGPSRELGPSVAPRDIRCFDNARTCGREIQLHRGRGLTRDEQRAATQLRLVGVRVVEHTDRPLRE